MQADTSVVLLSKSKISTANTPISQEKEDSNFNTKNHEKINGFENGYDILVLKMRNDSRLLSAVGSSLPDVCNNLFRYILQTRELSMCNTSSLFHSSTLQTIDYNNNSTGSYDSNKNHNNDFNGQVNGTHDGKVNDSLQKKSQFFFEFIDPQSTRNIIIPVCKILTTGTDNTPINNEIYWAIYDPFGSSSLLSPQTIGVSNIRRSTISDLEIPLSPTSADSLTEKTPFQAPSIPLRGSIRWGTVEGSSPPCHPLPSKGPITSLPAPPATPFSIPPLPVPTCVFPGEVLSEMDVTTNQVIVINGIKHPNNAIDATNMTNYTARYNINNSILKATFEILHRGTRIDDSKISNGISIQNNIENIRKYDYRYDNQKTSDFENYKLRKWENYDLRFLFDSHDFVKRVSIREESNDDYEISIMITRIDSNIDNNMKNNEKINGSKISNGVVIDGKTKFIYKHNPLNNLTGLSSEMNHDLEINPYILKVCFILSGVYHFNIFSRLKLRFNRSQKETDHELCCVGQFVVKI